MRTPLRWAAAACLALATPLPGQQTLVNFVPTDLNIPGSNYTQTPHDTYSSSQQVWNFDTESPLFNTWIPIYGGIKVTNNSTQLTANGTYARVQDEQVSQVAASAYLFSFAGGNGATVNTVDMALLWKRQDFTNSSGSRVVFTANSTLSVNILNWNGTTAVPAQIRFLVKNGNQYYISEANRTSAGTLTLTDFNANSTSGKRWAPFNPTATNFSLPASPSGFQAVTFDDVQAVGWIGRGAKAYGATYVCDAFSATGSAVAGDMAVGMNLAPVADYNHSQPFKDVLKWARGWLTRNEGGGGAWDTELGSFVTTDAAGWPLPVPFTQPYGAGTTHPNYTGNASYTLTEKQMVHTLFRVVKEGSYRLRFQGSGRFKLIYEARVNGAKEFKTIDFTQNSIASLPSDSAGKKYHDTLPIYLEAQTGGIAPFKEVKLEILESSGTNYLRNFEFVHESFVNDDLVAAPFNPDWLSSVTEFGGHFRLMDWGRTNKSEVVEWTDRTPPSRFRQTFVSGAAVEYQIMLANQSGRDLWVCIPAKASGNYTTNLARAILHGTRADGLPYDPGTPSNPRVWPALDPARKIYVEYSNETWNDMFTQSAYTRNTAAELRTSLGLPFSTNWVKGGNQYTSYRSAKAWQAFYDVFGTSAPDRIVRVLASSSANIGNSRDRLEAFAVPGLITENQFPDALATAPYYATFLAAALYNEGVVQSITDTQLLARIRASMEGEVTTEVQNHAALAQKYGVYFTTYEGGQHLVGTNSTLTGNQSLTDRLVGINRHSGMKAIQSDYMAMLKSYGVVAYTQYSDIGPATKDGSWGAREWLYQPYSTAYKFQAIKEFATANVRTNAAPIAAIPESFEVIDSDNNGSQAVTLSAAESRDYEGKVASVVWRINRTSLPGTTVPITLPVGEYPGYVTVVDNAGAVTQANFTVRVRPQGADTVLVRSSFSGSTAPGLTNPWTATSVLSTGITQSGWSYVLRTGNDGIIGGANVLDAFAVNLFYNHGTARSTLADALSLNQYLELTITPTAGKSLDLRGGTVKFTIKSYSDPNAARRVAVMTSVGGFAEGAQLFTTPELNAFRDESFTVQLPITAAYNGLTTPFKIRLYLYENVYNPKTTGLSAFELQGAVR